MLDALRGPVKAGAAALFAVGLLLLLLNPPELSGAEGLAVFGGAALALALLTAWAFVAMSGRDSMPDDEFERLVLRSEELARQAGPAHGATASSTCWWPRRSTGCRPTSSACSTRRRSSCLHLGRENRAYGHYFGDTVARDNYPDRIILYQDTLERDFGHDPELLRAQVERTLRHELAHHLGWGEPGVRDLGL